MSGEKAAPAARLDSPTERERAELITLIGTLTANQTAEVIRRAMREGLLVK